MTFGQQIIQFLFNINFPLQIPDGIEVMNPFSDKETQEIVERFYNLYYHDTDERWMIIGINPGRFGGGITGIPFTDPIRLERDCKIENRWPKKQELSSLFIYDVINSFGGPKAFYKKFYITAVSPLGFTRDNKNLNYYDDKTLLKDIKPFAIDCLQKQLKFGVKRNVAFCLGDGKNYKFLSNLNDERHFFDAVIPFSHPRFIMKYKLKTKQLYLDHYLSQFQKFCS
jgi:hypothetical protein